METKGALLVPNFITGMLSQPGSLREAHIDLVYLVPGKHALGDDTELRSKHWIDGFKRDLCQAAMAGLSESNIGSAVSRWPLVSLEVTNSASLRPTSS